jgi:short-subunit dehydrogenase
MPESRPLAIVTGASSGIGYELAKLCVEHDYDLVIAADQPTIAQSADELRAKGAVVESV